MKKLALTALTVLSCGIVSALPVGNPTDASQFTNGLWWGRSSVNVCDPCFNWCDAFSLRLGFYGEYVFNRHMALKGGDTDQADIDRTSFFTNAGYFALNICDWVDVFATVGATNFYLHTDDLSFLGVGTDVDLAWSPVVSWSVGGRATLWECDAFGIGIEGQYFRAAPDLDYFHRGADGTYTYFNSNNSTTYSEWQVGLGASYTFTVNCPGTAFIPYMAVTWAGSTFDLGSLTFTNGSVYTLRDLEAKKLWGYCVGLEFTQNEMVGATVEARFADEKAVSANLQIRF